MSLNVTVSLAVVGSVKQHSNNPDKYGIESYCCHNILPDGFTLPHGFRHQFNPTTSNHQCVWDLHFVDIYEEEAESLHLTIKEYELLSSTIKRCCYNEDMDSSGIVTLNNYYLMATMHGLTDPPYRELFELYKSYYIFNKEMKDTKVFLYIQNDEWC